MGLADALSRNGGGVLFTGPTAVQVTQGRTVPAHGAVWIKYIDLVSLAMFPQVPPPCCPPPRRTASSTVNLK